MADDGSAGGAPGRPAGNGGTPPARAVLKRSARFTATHFYRHPQWTEAENREAFGALSEPHHHDYVATVWVEGEMDPVTGFVTDLPALDEVLEELFGPLHGGDINASVPEFADGARLPSCENLARWAYGALSRALAPARVVRVRIAESDDLAAEFPADA